MQADFEANVEIGYVPLTISFTDLSIGVPMPISWDWNFGDGSIHSTEQNPIHTYTEFGSYTVTLTSYNGILSDTESKVRYVNVIARSSSEVPLPTEVGGGFTRIKGPTLIFD